MIADDLTAVEILLDNAVALADNYRPSADLTPRAAADAACAAVVLDFRLRAAQLAVRELVAAANSPARRDSVWGSIVGSYPPIGIATPGGPVRPPVAAGKGPTPGPAAALGRAACGSDGAVVAPVAGASPGRGERVDPSSRPVFLGGEGGNFLLPPIPSLPRFGAVLIGVGPVYDALPRAGGAR